MIDMTYDKQEEMNIPEWAMGTFQTNKGFSFKVTDNGIIDPMPTLLMTNPVSSKKFLNFKHYLPARFTDKITNIVLIKCKETVFDDDVIQEYTFEGEVSFKLDGKKYSQANRYSVKLESGETVINKKPGIKLKNKE